VLFSVLILPKHSSALPSLHPLCHSPSSNPQSLQHVALFLCCASQLISLSFSARPRSRDGSDAATLPSSHQKRAALNAGTLDLSTIFSDQFSVSDREFLPSFHSSSLPRLIEAAHQAFPRVLNTKWMLWEAQQASCRAAMLPKIGQRFSKAGRELNSGKLGSAPDNDALKDRAAPVPVLPHPRDQEPCFLFLLWIDHCSLILPSLHHNGPLSQFASSKNSVESSHLYCSCQCSPQ
jgi:hypothetical protein